MPLTPPPPSRLAALVLAALLAGCSALPTPPQTSLRYDFGPGPMEPASAEAAASAPRRAPLALAELQASGMPDNSTALTYRLAYADAQQPRPYTQARWSQPPTQLLQLRLQQELGQSRIVVGADDAVARARLTPEARGDAAAAPLGRMPAVLSVDLEEFSQVFTSVTDSVGLLRARATLVNLTPAGETLLGQRVFVLRVPAPSADAAGGARALATAASQFARDLAQWVAQTER